MQAVIAFVIFFVLGFLFSRQIIIAFVSAVVLTVATVALLAWNYESDKKEDEERRGAPREAVPESLVGVWEGTFGRKGNQVRVTVKPGKVGSTVADIRITTRHTECLETGTLRKAYQNRVVLKPERRKGTKASCGTLYTLTADSKRRVTFEASGSSGTLAPAEPRRGPKLSAILGTWRGSYTCRQGKTGMKLSIRSAGGDTVTAVFTFYPLRSNPDVARGSSAKKGTYRDGRLTLLPDRWIDKPDGYRPVGFSADVAGKKPRTMTGKVLSRGCTTFTIARQGR